MRAIREPTARRWMVEAGALVLIAVAALLFANSLFADSDASGLAATSPDEAARRVIEGCPEILKSANRMETFDLGMCLGVIKGLHYLSTDVCVPPATSLDDMASVITKYLHARPAETSEDFREISLKAMRSAWPCRGRKSI